MPTKRHAPRKRPYARIAITLPQEELAAADRLARARDRSRSWIIAEALRCYVTAQAATTTSGSQAEAMWAVATNPGLGEQRLRQLSADLRLTPEERVRAAEETARAARPPHRQAQHRLISFERYEDYLDWKRLEDAGA